MPILPPKFGQIKKLSPVETYLLDTLSLPPNLAGIPMISIPCDKMIGLHLMADHLQEEKILQVASAYEGMK